VGSGRVGAAVCNDSKRVPQPASRTVGREPVESDPSDAGNVVMMMMMMMSRILQMQVMS
jgi:hypothetical protein